MRLIPVLTFLVVALFLALILLGKTAPKMVGEQTPTDLPALTLEPFTGKQKWQQASLKNQVTFINFFASWCTPCAAEMPELIALKKQFPDIKIIGVVWNDDPKNMHVFLKQHGNPFDTIWLDPKGNATMALGIKGIPESFVIDVNSQVRYHIPGPLNVNERTGPLAAMLATLMHGWEVQNEVNDGL